MWVAVGWRRVGTGGSEVTLRAVSVDRFLAIASPHMLAALSFLYAVTVHVDLVHLPSAIADYFCIVRGNAASCARMSPEIYFRAAVIAVRLQL